MLTENFYSFNTSRYNNIFQALLKIVNNNEDSWPGNENINQIFIFEGKNNTLELQNRIFIRMP